jgi:hypothetical protein
MVLDVAIQKAVSTSPDVLVHEDASGFTKVNHFMTELSRKVYPLFGWQTNSKKSRS